MNSHSVLTMKITKGRMYDPCNYTAADRYQQKKEGVKSVLTTLFP